LPIGANSGDKHGEGGEVLNIQQHTDASMNFR
jgi:hypothetical protein